MKITCLSCSNTLNMGKNSISTKTCQYLKNLIKEVRKDTETNVLSLQDFTLKPCIFCGSCSNTSQCPYDEAFNELYNELKSSDYIFLVIPYYSIVPAKLTILLEKLNEIFYASWINDNTFSPNSSKIKVGIIGHGGMIENEQVLEYYQNNLITPVANTLKGLGYNILSPSPEHPNGIAFGLLNETDIFQEEGSIFPTILHDELHIINRIKPFIEMI